MNHPLIEKCTTFNESMRRNMSVGELIQYGVMPTKEQIESLVDELEEAKAEVLNCRERDDYESKIDDLKNDVDNLEGQIRKYERDGLPKVEAAEKKYSGLVEKIKVFCAPVEGESQKENSMADMTSAIQIKKALLEFLKGV